MLSFGLVVVYGGLWLFSVCCFVFLLWCCIGGASVWFVYGGGAFALILVCGVYGFGLGLWLSLSVGGFCVCLLFGFGLLIY